MVEERIPIYSHKNQRFKSQTTKPLTKGYLTSGEKKDNGWTSPEMRFHEYNHQSQLQDFVIHGILRSLGGSNALTRLLGS